MEALKTYLTNASWTLIFDAAIFLLAFVAMIVFLAKKRNYKLLAFGVVYVIVFAALQVVVTMSNGDYLRIGAFIARYFTVFLIVAFCVVYQTDLRTSFLRNANRKDSKYETHGDSEDDLIESANEIVKAVQALSKSDTGALILICPGSVPSSIVDTGTRLNCLVSSAVLQSIFNTKAPLHDGAVIIKNNTIIAAGCFLPLTSRTDLDKTLGTRHRAAIGVTECADVMSIVVSEESGIVSIAKKDPNNSFRRFITSEKLLDELSGVYGISVLSKLHNRK